MEYHVRIRIGILPFIIAFISTKLPHMIWMAEFDIIPYRERFLITVALEYLEVMLWCWKTMASDRLSIIILNVVDLLDQFIIHPSLLCRILYKSTIWSLRLLGLDSVLLYFVSRLRHFLITIYTASNHIRIVRCLQTRSNDCFRLACYQYIVYSKFNPTAKVNRVEKENRRFYHHRYKKKIHLHV